MSQYEDELQRDCCLDGMRDSPVSYTCERRSEYILDGPACIQAFLHCCMEMETQQAESKKDNLQLARSKRQGQRLGWLSMLMLLSINSQSRKIFKSF